MLKYKRILILILLVILPILALTGLFADLTNVAASSPEVVITVDTTDDELNDDGDCSLREAIQAANTDGAVDNCPPGSGADTIIIPAGTYTLTIPGSNEDANATGDLDILDELTLTGAGALSVTLDGGGLDRVLHVLTSTVTVEGLTVTNGYLSSFDPLLGSGGGILNQGGSLIVQSCVVQENVATSGGGLSNMAGSDAATELVVMNSQVLSNTTNGIGANGNWHLGGAGIFNRANSLNAQAVLKVSHSLVAYNQAIGTNHWREAMGGGITAWVHDCANCQATATVLQSTVRDNTAAIAGGIGIGELGTTVGKSELWVENSLIDGNTASGTAWGMGTGGGVGSNGETTILNSTISGNQALGTGDPINGKGGGIWISSNSYGQGALTLQSSTVANNHAVAGGGGIHSSQVSGLNPQLTFRNNIVAHNTAPSNINCLNGAGTFISQGYNLEDSNTCNFSQPTDLEDTDPLLGPLQDNGGTTWTYALLMGSPAMDHIPTGINNCGTTLTEDQRGIYRPQDGDGDGLAHCDIGAFEYLPSISLTGLTIEGPLTGNIETSNTFTATVSPKSATLPITYTWLAAGQEVVSHTDGNRDSIEITWELSGTYQITVTASNMFNSITNTHTINIGLAPEVSFASNSPVVLGDTAVFTNTTTGAEPIAYLWDFGDTSISTLTNPTHIYAAPGSYTATLTATNDFGSSQASSVFVVDDKLMKIYLPIIYHPSE